MKIRTLPRALRLIYIYIYIYIIQLILVLSTWRCYWIRITDFLLGVHCFQCFCFSLFLMIPICCVGVNRFTCAVNLRDSSTTKTNLQIWLLLVFMIHELRYCGVLTLLEFMVCFCIYKYHLCLHFANAAYIVESAGKKEPFKYIISIYEHLQKFEHYKILISTLPFAWSQSGVLPQATEIAFGKMFFLFEDLFMS